MKHTGDSIDRGGDTDNQIWNLGYSYPQDLRFLLFSVFFFSVMSTSVLRRLIMKIHFFNLFHFVLRSSFRTGIIRSHIFITEYCVYVADGQQRWTAGESLLSKSTTRHVDGKGRRM